MPPEWGYGPVYAVSIGKPRLRLHRKELQGRMKVDRGMDELLAGGLKRMGRKRWDQLLAGKTSKHHLTRAASSTEST